jgi:hypothetical protein
MKPFLIKTIIGLLLSTSLLAGTIDPLTPDEKYLDYGGKFHYILNICGINSEGELFNASCVAIDKNWVLTAAHVVDKVEFCGIMIDESKVLIIDEVIKHPNFDGSVGTADIALCKIGENLGLSFYPQLYDKNDEDGKLCCISGYGFTGTFWTGQKFYDGKRRAGSNIIDRSEQDLLICSPSKSMAEKLTQLEFLISSGDSGGGLFIDGKLAGINSCVSATGRTPKSIYGDEAGHTRISKFVEWINKSIKKGDE